MITMFETAAVRQAVSSRVLLVAVAGFGSLLLLIQRLWLAHDLPLWVDETWTASIASQAGWSDFWREAWLDCNPPLYYIFMALWTEVAGLSNAALRAPSLAFVILAAALPLLWRVPGLSSGARLCWAGMLFFWWHSAVLSVDARAYGMLLLVSTAQVIAFAKLLNEPTTRRAFAWSSLASVAILTHYYALFLAAVQGLVYLHLHRQAAIRTWPALLAFVPSFGWLFVHLPRLADYARADVAWYVPLGTRDMTHLLAFLIGAETISFLLAAVAALLASLYLLRGPAQPLVADIGEKLEARNSDNRLAWTAACAFIAFALILAVALVKPTLTLRYLTPLIPSAMLSIVLIVRHLHGTDGAYASVLLVYLAGSIGPAELRDQHLGRSAYGFQRASEELLAARPTHLVFAWEHPAAKILDAHSMRHLGSFFLTRAGEEVETVPIVISPGEDPNIRLTSAAQGERPAIIWLYNADRHSTASIHPPRIGEMEGWTCSHKVRGPAGIVVCTLEHLPE